MKSKNNGRAAIKPANKKLHAILIVLSGLFVLALYREVIGFGFLTTWDDNLYIAQNPDIQNLSFENIKLYFSKFYIGNYQPLTILAYALQYSIAGMNANLYHFTNIFLHILNSFLVIVFIKKIVPEAKATAYITAAFFAVHPMHVESVAWISELKDVLYTFFLLLALITYTLFLKERKLKYLFYTAILFLMSCLSKSAAVILPLLLLLIDYYKHRKINFKTLAEKIPFFIISLIFGITAILSQKTTIDAYAHSFPLQERLALISNSFFTYIYKAFLPVNLSALHPYPAESEGITVIYYISLIFIAIIAWSVWHSRKYGREVIFGFGFFLISIILVLQFLPVGNAIMAERYTYLPYIGIFFIAGHLIDQTLFSGIALLRKRGIYLSVLLSVLFVVFSFQTYQRAAYWANDEKLFTDVIKKYPDHYIAYLNRGSYYLNYMAGFRHANNQSESIKYIKLAQKDFETAVKFAYSPIGISKSYYNSGSAKAALNNHSGAIDDFNKALEIDPVYTSVYVNRANSYLQLSNFEGAMNDLNKALDLDPSNHVALNSRAKTKGMTGDMKGAIEDLDKAISIDKSFFEAYNNRGNAKNAIGDKSGAILDYNKAIELMPGFDRLYINRGIAKLETGNAKGALDDFNEALRLNPGNEEAYVRKNETERIIAIAGNK